MKINRQKVTQYLEKFNFKSLFIEELGWDYPQDKTDKYITVENEVFTLTPLAYKRNFYVFLCLLENQSIPLSATLKKIDKEITKYSYEHFIIYASQLDKHQKWQWVKRENNQPLVNRTIEYSSQKKEALLQVLDTIYVTLDEEEKLNLLDVKAKAKKAFDVDKITKKFYDKFKKQHGQFLSFIEGITTDFDKQWYASLMLNRLMFVYFIQKKGFLNSDSDYLRNKLNEIKNNPSLPLLNKRGVNAEKVPINKEDLGVANIENDPPLPPLDKGGGNAEKVPLDKEDLGVANIENDPPLPPLDKGGGNAEKVPLNKGDLGGSFYSFYRYFLLKLFHEGLGNEKRPPHLTELLGKIPYLNGGLFEIHPLENKYYDIQIKDEAFEKIFDFFDQYNWYLDDRPLKADNEINPDVLGYIFEKYINQKQMGAYYTKEDITEYISKNCIIPYLFDAVLTELNLKIEKVPLNKADLKGSNLENDPPLPPLDKGGGNAEKVPLNKGDLGGSRSGAARSNTENNPPQPPLKKGGGNGKKVSIFTHYLGGLLLQENPDRYIYEAVKKGVNLPLPDDIAKGINDVSARENWNQSAPENYSLPTEIWREVIARRNRYFEVKEKLINGEINSINDLITYNLDIRQFAQDAITNFNSPLTLQIFYEKLTTISILDPTCGSGAFLFSALNILYPLYDVSLEKMQEFTEKKIPINKENLGGANIENDPPQPPLKKGGANTKKVPLSKGDLGGSRSGAARSNTENDPPLPPLEKGGINAEKVLLNKGDLGRSKKEFQGILANVRSHPNRSYFILKNIILNNLYGVDIMEEATEVCKLRLFLKLASKIIPNPSAQNYGIEPLPDIDFNIRSGNSLVGFATYDEVKKAISGTEQKKLDLFDNMSVINDKAKAVSEVYQYFRTIQTQGEGAGFAETKQKLQVSLASLNEELNQYLAHEYGIDTKKKKDYQNWLASHQPFHWFTEFYSIINNGGFDVIIGNPPYVEYSKVKKDYQIKGYETEKCGNIYAPVLERGTILTKKSSFIGWIVPISSICTERTKSLQNCIKSYNLIYASSFDIFPSRLFEGAAQRLTILLLNNKHLNNKKFYLTKYYRWRQEERDNLIDILSYQNNDKYIHTGWIARITETTTLSIIDKIYSNDKNLKKYILTTSKNPIYIHRIVNNFIKAISFEPYFKKADGTITHSDDFKILNCQDKYIKMLICLLNSSLFYFYWRLHGDGFHCGFKDIEKFTCNLNDMSEDIKLQLNDLSDKLNQDFKKNSQIKIRKQVNTGEIELQTFFISKSKPIIDEIDKILAQHYGFSDEELDFIINYDIKYRMGKELDSD
ncbi:MAG: Eco57I restriction-modification methylase domain-containing protein [Cyanobacterium sp. T60_A2020_053]|nr:Eco57I restriction-modification methylase domain-containing protein [Cyanobacterium sp. T60_A2020_053]